MILTGSEIIKQVRRGRIIIDPFDDNLVNPNSYNYRLGDTLKIINDPIIDSKKDSSFGTIKISKDGYTLVPGVLYLGHTFETIGSDKYVTSLIGRSSVGRLGMFLQITADLGQLGSAHKWTLEIRVTQPLRVYPGVRIGQVSFWQPYGTKDRLYKAGYTEYNLPHGSEINKYFGKDD